MQLSIVVPAYNEEMRVGDTLNRVLGYLAQQTYGAEIIVVDDGSRDGTAGIVARLRDEVPSVRLFRNGRNRGKGFSVREGFLRARGQYVLFSDTDLSTPIEEVEKLLTALEEPYDIAIASRALPGSRIEVHQAPSREHMGRLFNFLVQALLFPGIWDTQCGFKCFTGEAAHDICRRMTLERFAFDVEMLYLARLLEYRVREMPVVWRNSPQTRVHLVRDSVSMLRDLVRIRWNHLRGRYGVRRRRAPGYDRRTKRAVR